MFVCCECCLLSGGGLCDELITRPEESYRLWCVVVCDRGTSRMGRPWPALGRSATGVGGPCNCILNSMVYQRLTDYLVLSSAPLRSLGVLMHQYGWK